MSGLSPRVELQFDLEQQIMLAWQTKEDLETFLEAYMDGPTPMTEDQTHNLVYGIACMHDLRCNKAFNLYEKLLKAYKEELEGVRTQAYNKAVQDAADRVAALSDYPVATLGTEPFRDRAVKAILKLGETIDS